MYGMLLVGMWVLGYEAPKTLPEAKRVELHRAIWVGDTAKLDSLLAEYPHMLDTHVLESKLTPTLLSFATAWKRYDIAEHFRKRGAKVDLQSAARMGWDDEIREIAKRDPKSIAGADHSNSPLIDAIWHNRLSTFKLLLDLGSPIWAKEWQPDSEADRIIISAIMYDRAEFVRALLEKMDEPAWNYLGPRGLRAACGKNEKETTAILALLMAKKPPLHRPEWDGAALLRRACQSGNVTAVRMLLQAKVDPNTPHNPENPYRLQEPLEHFFEAVESILFFIDGVSSNNPDRKSQSEEQIPLRVQYLHSCITKLVLPFVGASALTNLERSTLSPIHMAAVSGDITDDRIRHEIADLLVRAGAKWNFQAAVALGKTDLVRQMLAADPGLVRSIMYRRVFGRDSWKWPQRRYDGWPLDEANAFTAVLPHVVAAHRGYTDIVRLLLTVPVPKLRGEEAPVLTAAHAAAEEGHAEVLKVLTADPARREAILKVIDELFVRAARSGNARAVHHLATLRKPTPKEADAALLAAASAGHLDTVKKLVELGAAIDTVDEEAATPLYRAAEKGANDVVVWLLEQKADPNRNHKSDDTPLHVAAAGGHVACVKALLARRAEIDQKGRNAQTPLMRAALADQPETFRVLMLAGASRKGQDRDGNSALHMAVESGALSIVQDLLQLGVDQGLNAKQETPLDTAERMLGYPDAPKPKPRLKIRDLLKPPSPRK